MVEVRAQGDAQLSDVVDTLCDAISSAVLYIYVDLVRTGVLSPDEAAEKMRSYADHMSAEKHSARIVGLNVAAKIEDFATLIEKAALPK